MEPYKMMYFTLTAKAEHAIKGLENALSEAEEIFLSADDEGQKLNDQHEKRCINLSKMHRFSLILIVLNF